MDIYNLVVERIISELEQDIIPWYKPWTGTAGAISHTTGKRYYLLNQLMFDVHTSGRLTFLTDR